jgi:hypothetical protein
LLKATKPNQWGWVAVLISTPSTYPTHTAWLMRPIMAGDMNATFAKSGGDGATAQVGAIDGREGATLPICFL